jgi:4-alpha-glucanotransferase
MDLSRRCSGVVLHLTSLPGPHGSGDLGDAACAFADWLADAGQTLWQTLPLTPVGPGDSPYQSPSAFAGNPLLVALEPLVRRGWLAPADDDVPAFDATRVDYRRVIPWRLARLREAAAGFSARATRAEREAFAAWRDEQAAWLEDHALYAAIKAAHGHGPWWDWPAPLRHREPAALRDAARTWAAAIEAEAFAQWCFDEQLAALKAHANARGVHLMGDMPIFVAHDSADVWARPGHFKLDPATSQPTAVAGVPPDAYTADGQRWGNPLYRWDRMADDGYAWWTARIERLLQQCDVFRLDHFRGFAGCWEIPAECPTARDGRWVPGPGGALFDAIEARLGRLPIVAEDLGTITPDVVALRDRHAFPGMRIVYEGFLHGPRHPFLPHHHTPRGLAYTSTHDSDTVRGWWDAAPPDQRDFARTLLGADVDADPAWAVLRATWASVSNLALAPVQDLLGLGTAQRMNRPGTGDGNWAWRLDGDALTPALAQRLAALTRAADRAPAVVQGEGRAALV